jgi:DNA replication protein DnaC
MPYSIDTLQKAKELLSERRMNAIRRADYQREQLYKACPRLAEIDRALSEIGSAAARAVLRGGDVADSLTKMSEQSLALQDEYARLLRDLGISADEIVPDYHCKKCSDTGYIEENNRTRVCDCLMKLMSDVECESLNMASPLELSTFESFRLDYYSDRPDANGAVPLNRMSKILNYCRSYADTFSKDSRSILMRGATGLGKTHLSLAIANEVIRRGFSVVYVSAPDILTKLEREHFSYRYNEEDAIQRSLTSCDLLIIDDLGTEFASQYSVAAIYNIFNSRILAGKPIILSTNLTMNELLTTYSQRFVSRVMGSCDKLDFIGEDIRPRL